MNTSNRPFFIIGMQRSGTTLLRLILNRHSRLAVPFESGFMMHFYQRMADYGDLNQVANKIKLLDDLAQDRWVIKSQIIQDKDQILTHSIASYSDLLHAIFFEYAQAKGKPRWGDKTPGHLIEIDTLWKLFPKSKFVHLVRDGRDVALSYATMSWGSAHLPKVAQRWYWDTLLAHKIGNILGSDYYLEVHYEDLIFHPEKTLKTLCEFLDENYESDMLASSENSQQEMPGQSMQWHQSSVSQLNKSKVYAWKKNMVLEDQMIFDEIAGEGLDLFGYERVKSNSNINLKVRKLYYMFVKRW